jgi:hypothetical protein
MAGRIQMTQLPLAFSGKKSHAHGAERASLVSNNADLEDD